MSLDLSIFGLWRNEDRNLCALEEEALELTFKIGGEGLLADGGADFFEGPKASTIKLVFWRIDFSVIDRAMHNGSENRPLTQSCETHIRPQHALKDQRPGEVIRESQTI